MDKVLLNFSIDQLVNFFEITVSVDWIRENGFKRISLQFPDQMLCISAKIVQLLEGALDGKIKAFILADTSYRSCCVDMVAAEQAGADCILHYGDACMSTQGDHFPVRYVYGQWMLDYAKLELLLNKHCTKFGDKCILLYDVLCATASAELLNFLKARLEKDVQSCDLIYSQQQTLNNDSLVATLAPTDVCLGRKLPSMDISNATLIFIGDNDSPLLSMWLMSNPSCSNVFTFSPLTSECSFAQCEAMRALRKRLFLIEKFRDASTIGILINPLNIIDYGLAMNRARDLCKAAGKKYHILSIGKLNECKLLNFATDIDAFVVISCPYGVVLDTANFYKPIVSFFEADVALNPANKWCATSGWTAEFGNVLSNSEPSIPEEASAEVSLITGQVRSVGISDNQKSSNTDCRELIELDIDGFNSKRSWKGLDDGCEDGASLEVTEGRRGTSSQYTCEPTD